LAIGQGKLGVANRLWAGLAAMALVTIGGSLIAVLSFNQMRGSLDHIASTQLDTMVAAAQLRQDSQAIAGLAPSLIVKGLEQKTLIDFSLKIYSQQTQLQILINQLAEYVEAGANITRINTASADLFQNIDLLSTAIYSQAVAEDELNVALRDVSYLFRQVNELVGKRRQIDKTTTGEDVAPEDGASDDWAVRVQPIETIVVEAIATHESGRLLELAEDVDRYLAAAQGEVDRLGVNDSDLRLLHAKLVDALTGERGVITLRGELNKLNTEARELLAQNEQLSTDLVKTVESLMTEVRSDIVDQNATQGALLSERSRILWGLAALGIIGAVAIGSYFQLSVVRRLGKLRHSMLNEQSGESAVSLTQGRDEIAEMARSFIHFVGEINRRDEAIRQSRQRLTSAIESISEGFSLYDRDDRLIVCNNRYKDLLYAGLGDAVQPGATFESIIRRALERGLIPEAVGRSEIWVEQRLARHRSPTEPHVQRRADGRWVRVSERKTEEGGTVAVYTDMTEIKESEEALRASEARFRHLFDSAPISIWEENWTGVKRAVDQLRSEGVTDFRTFLRERPDVLLRLIREIEWVDFNEATVKLYRAGTKDVLRQHIGKGLISLDTYPESIAAFIEGTRQVSVEATDRTVDDKPIRVVETYHLARDDAQDWASIVACMQDITAHKHAEEQLRIAKNEAEQALQQLKSVQQSLIHSEKMASLGQVTAGIAHEIKNPLNFVNNFAEVSSEILDELRASIDNASATLSDSWRQDALTSFGMLKANLAKINEHGKRADRIVKSMLSHARAEPGTVGTANLNSLIDESLNLAYHGARAENQSFNIALEHHFDPNVGEIAAYPQELTRVFLNLFGNGFYATQKRQQTLKEDGYKPALIVSTRDLGREVEVRVRDNGTGIPRSVIEKIFNPFFTTKPPGEGTGLGLSLSYETVVHLHHGRFDVDSHEGEYTEFVVTLPREQAGSKVMGGAA
jgi:signal transduction histidine kinase/HAMP domain-containing protein